MLAPLVLGLLANTAAGVDRKRTGNLPSRVSAHTIRDDIEMQIGKESKGVLVRATVLTLLCSSCSVDSQSCPRKESLLCPCWGTWATCSRDCPNIFALL